MNLPTRNIAIFTAPAHNAPPTMRIADPIIMEYFRLYLSEVQALKRHPNMAPALFTPFNAPIMFEVCE
jgi:hypothetical protein